MTFTITAAKAFCENTTEEKLRLMQDGGKVEAQESLKRIKLEQDQAKQALRAKGIVIR
jgi:hypothetical protein